MRQRRLYSINDGLVCMYLFVSMLAIGPSQTSASSDSNIKPPSSANAKNAVGPRGFVGATDNANVINRLTITRPGVYENLIVDGRFEAINLVKIKADNVILRNCEIRNSLLNGIEVYAKNVVIENCRIHHLLSKTFKDQDDTQYGGAKVQVRNCAMYDSKVGVRMEDCVDLKMQGLAFGHGIKAKYVKLDGGAKKGFENTGEQPAPPLQAALTSWGAR
ncbi:MAG: right-handed parallel beta-helix repeat-containing protein [Planctomycetota bacterium]